jgi:hypothetical protein
MTTTKAFIREVVREELENLSTGQRSELAIKFTPTPVSAGNSWEKSEDIELEHEFETFVAQVAVRHKRTQTAIHYRVAKLISEKGIGRRAY